MDFIFLGEVQEYQSLSNSAGCPTVDLEELASFVGIKESVRAEIFESPMIQNYFEYESGQSKPIIKDRLKSAKTYWRDVIKAPPSVINIIDQGVTLDFITEPPNIETKKQYFCLKKQ